MSLHPAFQQYIETVAGYYAEAGDWSELRKADEIALAAEAFTHYPLHHIRPVEGERGVRVYIIRDPDGHVKIGISDNPASRVRSLAAGNARGLTVVYQTRPFSRAFALAVERAAHDHLAGCALGREWFRCSVESAIETLHLLGGTVG